MNLGDSAEILGFLEIPMGFEVIQISDRLARFKVLRTPRDYLRKRKTHVGF